MSNDNNEGTEGDAPPDSLRTRAPRRLSLLQAKEEFNRRVVAGALNEACELLLERPLYDNVARHIKKAGKGILTPEELSDVFQEAASEFVGKLISGFLPNKPLGLLIAIAQKRGVDLLRRKIRRREVQMCGTEYGEETEGDAGGGAPEQRIAAPTDPDPLLKQELEDALDEVIEGLPPAQRRVAKAVVGRLREENCDLPGLFPAVAKLIGRTPRAVRDTWKRARVKIRSRLRQNGWEPNDGPEFEQGGSM